MQLRSFGFDLVMFHKLGPHVEELMSEGPDGALPAAGAGLRVVLGASMHACMRTCSMLLASVLELASQCACMW